MKTKILSLAVTLVAVASLAPSAWAGQSFSYPRPKLNSNPSPGTTVDCCVAHESCKGKSCCATKLVSTGPRGGRSTKVTTFLNYKKVRVCTQACGVPSEKRQAVCRSGFRA